MLTLFISSILTTETCQVSCLPEEGNYTGVPDISIPLYTLNAKKVNIDISISYHAMGNRVGEEATALGLGWALNAGGIIRQDRRGITTGNIDGTYHPSDNPALWNSQPYFWLHFLDATNNVIDAEPDIFTFNFNGYSGNSFRL